LKVKNIQLSLLVSESLFDQASERLADAIAYVNISDDALKPSEFWKLPNKNKSQCGRRRMSMRSRD
jgi:hypothetical protein